MANFIETSLKKRVSPDGLKAIFDRYTLIGENLGLDIPANTKVLYGVTPEEYQILLKGDVQSMYNIVFKYSKKALKKVVFKFIIFYALAWALMYFDNMLAPYFIGVSTYFAIKYYFICKNWLAQDRYGKQFKEKRKDENHE